MLLLKRPKYIPEFSSSLPEHMVLVRRIKPLWSEGEGRGGKKKEIFSGLNSKPSVP